MNRSAVPVVLVPPGVVTFTSTVPLPAGLTAVICVALTSVGLLAATFPNFTWMGVVKPVPVIVTFVPPLTGPAVGSIFVTVGTGT